MKTDNIQACVQAYPPSISRSIHNAMELINADVSNHFVLKDLAKNAGTNECTLKKGFKGIFKITVYQHLLKKRMGYAVHLLQTTNCKENDIAIQCGYESLSGFITTFRKYFGLRPGELRKHFILKKMRNQQSVYQ